MKTNQKAAIGLMLIVLAAIAIFIPMLQNKNEDVANASTVSYPYEFTDGYGDKTTIDKVPERIVSFSPNITEILCELGLESKLVGRTDYCDYPETVSSVKSVGQIQDPNMEVVLELAPDIVITDGMQTKDFVLALRAQGIKVICLRANTELSRNLSDYARHW